MITGDGGSNEVRWSNNAERLRPHVPGNYSIDATRYYPSRRQESTINENVGIMSEFFYFPLHRLKILYDFYSRLSQCSVEYLFHVF